MPNYGRQQAHVRLRLAKEGVFGGRREALSTVRPVGGGRGSVLSMDPAVFIIVIQIHRLTAFSSVTSRAQTFPACFKSISTFGRPFINTRLHPAGSGKHFNSSLYCKRCKCLLDINTA